MRAADALAQARRDAPTTARTPPARSATRQADEIARRRSRRASRAPWRTRCGVGPRVAAEHDRAGERLVVALRIDDAELVALLAQPLEQAGRQGRLAAARLARDEQAHAGGAQHARRAVGRVAEQHAAAPRRPRAQVVGEHRVDQFRRRRRRGRARARGRRAPSASAPRWRWPRPLRRAAACVVVLGVADGDDVVRRQTESLERRREPGRLVDAGRQHHHRALVEDHLQLEAEIADARRARRSRSARRSRRWRGRPRAGRRRVRAGGRRTPAAAARTAARRRAWPASTAGRRSRRRRGERCRCRETPRAVRRARGR